MPSMQNQQGFHGMIPPLNQGSHMRGITSNISHGMAPRKFSPMQSVGYVGSGYPAGLQYPRSYPGGIMSQRPDGGSLSAAQPSLPSGSTLTSSGVGTSSSSQVEG